MKLNWAGVVAVLLSLFLPNRLAAQPARELRGQVFHLGENGEKIFEPGLIITFVETGATDDANDQGIFRLPLPPAFQPGDSITISIDKPGWRIRYPLDGEARIPRDLLREIVSVELLQVGSKLFWTHDRIEKFIRDASERSKQEGRQDGRAPALDLGREIKEWAAKYGFNAQEAREEIDRWIAEVEAAHEDNYRKGLADFAKQQFDAAAAHFRDSAEWRIRQLEETRKQQEKLEEKAEQLQEEVVRDLRLQGNSHYYAYHFEQALASYKQALQYTSEEQSPQLWAATLNDIGSAHQELGSLGEAVEHPAHLAAAVQAYRQALLVRTLEQLPQAWAVTQNNLGNALQQQGMRTSGEEGAQLLAQAVQAYSQTLLVYTREQLPENWAAIQNNLGSALREQGARTSGEKGAQLFAQAVQAYRKAVLVYKCEQLPQQWAAAQNNLGNALAEQGTRTSGEEGAQLLTQAVEAYQQGLLVFTPTHLSGWWAKARGNEARTLLALDRYNEAADALSEVFSKEPSNRQIFLLLVTTLNDRLFHHQEAVALTRNWLTRHPNDLRARLALGEQLFASRAFPDCSQEIAPLLKEQELSTEHRIVALGYAIAAGLAMGSPDMSDRVEELLGVVAAQSQDFKISRTFEGTLHSLGEEPGVPHQDELIRLFQALAVPDRDNLLAGLQGVKEKLQQHPEGGFFE